MYYYTIGASWDLVIPKPTVIRADNCSTTCAFGYINPSNYSWITDEGSYWLIEPIDMALVSGQDFVDVTDFTIKTDSPGSCSDSFNPTLRITNPCQ